MSPALRQNLPGGKEGDLPGVERRGDLHQVEPDDGQPLEKTPEKIEQLPGIQPAKLWGARPRGERGVERVDIDRKSTRLNSSHGS